MKLLLIWLFVIPIISVMLAIVWYYSVVILMALFKAFQQYRQEIKKNKDEQ